MSPILGSRSFGRWSVSPIGDAGGPWWYGTMNYSSGYNYSGTNDHGIASDNLGNLYFSRGGQNTGYGQMSNVLSVDNSGAARWQRQTAGGSYKGVGGFKSSYISKNGYGSANHYVQVANLDGTINWGRIWGNNYASGNTICTFPVEDGTVLNKAMYNGGPDYMEGVIRYNSSGTALWGAGITYGYAWQNGIYHKGDYSYYWNNGTLAKINSSGTFVQYRYLSIDRAGKIGVDNSDNVYGGSSTYIGKYDSSLIPTWGLQISPADNSYGNGSRCATLIDSNNNVYHVLATNQTNAKLRVIKVNSSGTVQWIRKLTNAAISGDGNYFWDFTLSNNNDLVFYTIDNSYPWNNASYIIKLPNDGTKTGSYYPYTWAAETDITVTSTTLSQSNASTNYGSGGSDRGSSTYWSSTSNFYWSKSGDIA